MREICKLDGIAIYFEIVESMEMTLANGTINRHSTGSAKLCKNLGAGEQALMRSVSGKQRPVGGRLAS